MNASTRKPDPAGQGPDGAGAQNASPGAMGESPGRPEEPGREFGNESFERDSPHLSFSQAQGHEALPRALKLEELPCATRVQIWNLFYVHLEKSANPPWMADGPRRLNGDWADLLLKVHVQHDNRPIDEWDDRFKRVCRLVRHRIETLPFNRVFDLVQYVLRQPECPVEFRRRMQEIFAGGRLAYRILGSSVPTIVPAATEAEGEAIAATIRELSQAGLAGGETHLRQSATCINRGDWAGSLRESIHAVESVARKLAREKTKSLTQAINLVDEDIALHPRLKQACKMLYRYTSDEQGIRHALLDRTRANVGMDEALFMLGACASFASYLWRKHAQGETS